MHVIEPSFVALPFLQTMDEEEIKKTIIEQIDQLNSEADIKYILFVEYGSASSFVTPQAQKTKAVILIFRYKEMKMVFYR